MNPIKVWWRRELVQVVHVQAAPGRTVCGLDIPDSARTAPGREVVCAVCRAALAEDARPAATRAQEQVGLAAALARIEELEGLAKVAEAERVALSKRAEVLAGELKASRRAATVAGRREVQAREDATTAGHRALVAEAEVARLAERVGVLERRLSVEELARRSVEARLADAQGETRRALDALKAERALQRPAKSRKGAA